MSNKLPNQNSHYTASSSYGAYNINQVNPNVHEARGQQAHHSSYHQNSYQAEQHASLPHAPHHPQQEGSSKPAVALSRAQKAARTRKANDPNAFQKMGQKGAVARHNKSEEEERAIARKAAQTRKENDPAAFSRMGQQGAEARHKKSAEEESLIAKKAAQTRKAHDPLAFEKMGQKGGSARHRRAS